MTIATTAGRSEFTFCALAFGLFGWALFHTSLGVRGAALSEHIRVALLGCIPVAIAYRNCHRYRIEFGNESVQNGISYFTLLLKNANIGWIILLFVLGAILGKVVLFGGITPLFAFALGVTFVPWSRIPICRRHFIASISIIAIGIAFTLLVNSRALSSISLAVSAMVFWMFFLFSLILRR